jgi:hypothetical protein
MTAAWIAHSLGVDEVQINYNLTDALNFSYTEDPVKHFSIVKSNGLFEQVKNQAPNHFFPADIKFVEL